MTGTLIIVFVQNLSCLFPDCARSKRDGLGSWETLNWIAKTTEEVIVNCRPLFIPEGVAYSSGTTVAHISYHRILKTIVPKSIKSIEKLTCVRLPAVDTDNEFFWAQCHWVYLFIKVNASVTVITIRCKFFFLFIGWKPTTWPANNCLQVMAAHAQCRPTVPGCK